MTVQFLTDASGKRTAAVIPIAEWERLQPAATPSAPPKPARRPKLSKKEQFKEDFGAAVREMKQMQAGEIPKTSLRNLLDELREV